MESTGSSRVGGMTDRFAIDALVADCERYWKAAGLPRRVVADMRAQLERHLIEASLEGRSPESVVGADTAAFAMEWAAAEGPDGDDLPAWEDVVRRRRRRFEWTDLGILMIVAGAIVVGLATRGQGDSMDNETWRWIWVGAALFLGFAEMVTAGFFMLPFAVGAVIAAVLAFMDVAPEIQLTVFIASSLLSLVLLQRLVRKDDEHQPAVGSNRFVGQRAVVLQTVDRSSGTGRVRMDTEEWRAVTDGDPIDAGTEVEVVDVRGARLVVEVTE
jgi:membrane protein implicated in regulation of membrane protease activity